MIQKQNVNLAFGAGLDLKTDKWQVQPGKFLSLQNSVFQKGGLLSKRNGYEELASLPNDSFSYLTTLNGNLTAVGSSIAAYSDSNETWINKGTIAPMRVATLPLLRNSVTQTQADSIVSNNGLVCTVYTEVSNSTTTYKYVIADATTGQNVVAPTLIPSLATGTITGSSRVFLVGSYFVIVSTTVISATSYLQYFAISSLSPTTVTVPNNVYSEAYISATTLSWDGVVANNTLVVAYNSTAGGQGIHVTYLSLFEIASGDASSVNKTFTAASDRASIVSVCVDTTSTIPVYYISFYSSALTTGYTCAVTIGVGVINTVFTPQEIIASGTFLNLASAAQNGVCTVFAEAANNYGYDSSIPTHFIDAVTVTVAGVVGTPYVAIRSVGLASKAFIVNEVIYFLAAFQSPFQNTYFLVNGSTTTAAAPVVSGKLAYENGGGYLTTGLPSALVQGTTVKIAYLFKDLLEALATLSNSQQTTTGGIYSQTGINLGSFDITNDGIDTAEIGNDLHLSGGFLWMYDAYLPVEHNFFLWPDSVEVTTATGSGSISAQQYYYQAVYSWTDNQGNAFRSAPSVPTTVTTTTGSSTNTIYVPTLRLTYKTENPVKIELYRWSAANQNYYQISSNASQSNPVLAPKLNDTTVDYVTFTDTWADSSIVGNNLIYTTGGVVEDVNGPASNVMALFDTRLWLVDAEDPNLLWVSKSVIEGTPVEMSDLFTIYIPPNTGTEEGGGPITALFPMDDKLIIFSAEKIVYINGSGPDNLGTTTAGSPLGNYSQAIFITSTVGCTEQQSIALTPNGLQFQTDKGLWLLDRSNLTVSYIGAPVEDFNGSTVNSAVNVPATTQIRFTLSTGEWIMYDYYFNQYGTFTGIPAISSCIYQKLHTYINAAGQVFQETPGLYLDGSNPVLMSFTTAWFSLTGLQGYQRAYWFYLLGEYKTPHKLYVQTAYDYNPAILQGDLVQPTNFSSATPSSFGIPVPMGSSDNVENWRVNLQKERCSSFQITLNEIYDPSMGAAAGEGFTLSGLNLVFASKRGWRTIDAAHQVGGGNNSA